MAFRYACFISYCHGQYDLTHAQDATWTGGGRDRHERRLLTTHWVFVGGFGRWSVSELVKSFIDQLKTALKAELDALMNEELYIDEERLLPGYHYNEELAKAICESVCMVVVYMPKYESHEYCIREFEAMELLEKKRDKLLGQAANPSRGFIIPIILRGNDDIPPKIKRYTHYADFSHFTLATQDIIRNPGYVEEIKRIAKVIHQHYKAFVSAGADPCTLCSGFKIPPASAVSSWRPQFPNR